MLSTADTIKPSEVSCSDLTASDPQRLIVNKMVCSCSYDVYERNT